MSSLSELKQANKFDNAFFVEGKRNQKSQMGCDVQNYGWLSSGGKKKSRELSGNGGKDLKTSSTNASQWLQDIVASHLKVTRLSPVCCCGDSLGAFWLSHQPILNHSSQLTLLLSLSSPLHKSYIMCWRKMLASFWEERGI